MGLRCGPLRANLVFACGLGKFKLIFELELIHASRSSLSRLPSGTHKPNAQKPSTYISPKVALSRKNTWRGLTYPLASHNPQLGSAHGGVHGGASGSGIYGHGVSTHGQKRKLTPHEQNKKTRG